MRHSVFLAITMSLTCLSSCKNPVSASKSTLKLSAGSLDESNEYQEVFGIADGSPAESGTRIPFCTGTAISASVLITAAHCFHKVSADAPIWLVDANLVPVTDESGLVEGVFKMNPVVAESSVQFENDVALVSFPRKPFKHFYRFASHPATAGEDVTLVGYGVDTRDANPSRGRQYGFNKIFDVVGDESRLPDGNSFPPFDLSMIWLVAQRATPPLKRAVGTLYFVDSHEVATGTVPGDSGSPLLRTKTHELLGTLNGGGPVNRPEDSLTSDSFYVNIFHPNNLKFFREMAAEGWEIPNIPEDEDSIDDFR